MYKQTAITSLDSYKIGHIAQYPEGTTKVYSNFTPRSDRLFQVPDRYNDHKIVWVGMKNFLVEMQTVFQETFFNVAWDDLKQEIESFYGPFCGPNGVTTEHFKALWDLGYLPLDIRSLPEGVAVKVGIPTMTITNTKPEFFWLPNYLETWLSAALWKASTSATTARVYQKILKKYQEITGGNKDFMAFQMHDFSVRGMSGIADAALSGLGHLAFSLGTDNLPAVKLVNDVYEGKKSFVGCSVPATEHSVMCAGGKESELETFRRLIRTYPSGVVSIVSDTWDFWNVLTNIAVELKDEILARQPDSLGLAKVVFRPDSGIPELIICGDRFAEPGTPEYKGAVQVLWEIFGGTVNEKGYKTLNQRVGLIYGDSITPQRADTILKLLADQGFASDNIVFGVGSYTYQYQTRDTLGFAMKATYVEINGVGQAIFKDPKTDSGTKKSARGLLAVGKKDGEYFLMQDVEGTLANGGELKPVYLNGEILTDATIETIRANAVETL